MYITLEGTKYREYTVQSIYGGEDQDCGPVPKWIERERGIRIGPAQRATTPVPCPALHTALTMHVALAKMQRIDTLRISSTNPPIRIPDIQIPGIVAVYQTRPRPRLLATDTAPCPRATPSEPHPQHPLLLLPHFRSRSTQRGARLHHTAYPPAAVTLSSSPSRRRTPPPSTMSADNAGVPMSRQMSNIAMAVSFYWIISISMVFANKTLLGNQDIKSAPFFITWSQCVVTVLFCYIAGSFKVANVPPFEVRPDILKQMLSLSLIFTCMIVFNNLCLKYVEVSFYQVARSLTIVFNVIFDLVILGQVTSLPAIGCCALVVSGFALGNVQEVRWSLVGVLFGVTSSFFVAMNSIFVKKKFSLVDNNPWKITLYNNVNASFLFLPLILFSGEIPVILNSPLTRTPHYWFLLGCSGLLGVSISFATAAQIKYTSPLTHNVSATAKSAAQTVIALMVYRNPSTSLFGLSVFIVLAGSFAYTLVRRSEMKKKAAQQEADQAENVKEGLISSATEARTEKA